MPILLLGASVLLLILCLLLIWSGQGSSKQAKAAVLQWYRTRKQEIESDSLIPAESKQQLLVELDARVLEDIDNASQALSSGPQPVADQPLVWLKPLLIVVLFVAGTTLYWYLGGARDIFIAEELSEIDGNTDAAGVARVIAQVESRVRQTPDNAHYWALLARYYTAGNRHLDALSAYEELLRLGPDDASALALAAQAEYLLEQRKLTATAMQRAKRALELEPRQMTALGLLGIAAFEQEQFQQAIEYWQRLLSGVDTNNSSLAVIEQGIARARMQLGQQPAEQTLLPAVVVQVSLAAGAAAKPEDTVFVLARIPGQRMPIAVKKYQVADLPLAVRIDDRDSMLENRKLSAYAGVEIVARVSPSGKPGQQYSTLEAIAGPVEAAIEAPRLSLQLAAPRQP